jgi:hypothetical protein
VKHGTRCGLSINEGVLIGKWRLKPFLWLWRVHIVSGLVWRLDVSFSN